MFTVLRDDLDFVRSDDERDTCAGGLSDQDHDVTGGDWIEMRNKFVGEHQLRMLHEGTGDRYTLLFPAAEAVDLLVRFVTDTELLEEMSCFVQIIWCEGFDEGCQRTSAPQRSHQHIVHDGEVFDQTEMLWNISHPTAYGTPIVAAPAARDVDPEDADPPPLWA